MKLEFTYQPVAGRAIGGHFLLEGSNMSLRVTLEDKSVVDVPVVRMTSPGFSFTADLTPAHIPKKMIRLEMIYRVDRDFDGQSFKLLEIHQNFGPQLTRPNAVANADYDLTPDGWRDGAGRMRIQGFAGNPLLDLSQLMARKIGLRVSMLDLTQAWLHLNRTNERVSRYQLRSADKNLTFKVFGYVGGVPLIWYAVVPAHLRGAPEVSPHVFYSAADNAIEQDVADKAYLSRGATAFEAEKANSRLMFRYLTAPVEPHEIPGLEPYIPDIVNARNLVRVDTQKIETTGQKVLSPTHWNVGVGLQKAFMHEKDGKPAQFLLLPQRREGWNGHATTRFLKPCVDAVMDLIETNTDLFAGASSERVRQGKMVLSCFSESGVDIWISGLVNKSLIKAIIAIEGQNTNSVENADSRNVAALAGLKDVPVGKDVIPVLLKNDVKVFIIARHHAPKFRPVLTAEETRKVTFLPRADPAAIFAFPPNPDANDFIKYRVHRLLEPGSDPMTSDEEWGIFLKLASRGLTGRAAFNAIFRPEVNVDNSGLFHLQQWYSHNFALSGGEEMTFDPAAMYTAPTKYRTFFQTAVHEIG